MSKVTDYLKIVTKEEVKDFVVIHFGESWTLCVPHTMKENLQSLKDSIKLWRRKFMNVWLEYQKMCILTNKAISFTNTTVNIREQSKGSLLI